MNRKWFVALVFATAVVLASCDSFAPQPTAVRTPVRLLGGIINKVQFLACTPADADSTTVTVGPDGGTITVGAHSLDIPTGALDSSVAITMVVPSDTLTRVTLLPTGLTFNHPATLTISYASCSPLAALVMHRIVYIDGSFDILDVLPTSDDPVNQRASTNLHHFSDYAIAW